MVNSCIPLGLCKNFLNRFLIIVEGDVIAIEPPLSGEDRALYDGAKMALNRAQSLLKVVK